MLSSLALCALTQITIALIAGLLRMRMRGLLAIQYMRTRRVRVCAARVFRKNEAAPLCKVSHANKLLGEEHCAS